jgi:hypothetical protein
MDILSDPGSIVMERLQSIFKVKPLLFQFLKKYKP